MVGLQGGVLLAVSQALSYAAWPQIQGPVHCVVCLFTAQLIYCTYPWPAWINLSGWLLYNVGGVHAMLRHWHIYWPSVLSLCISAHLAVLLRLNPVLNLTFSLLPITSSHSYASASDSTCGYWCCINIQLAFCTLY